MCALRNTGSHRKTGNTKWPRAHPAREVSAVLVTTWL